MNADALTRARAGIFSLAQMQEYTTGYIRAGGKASFSEYYTAHYESAIFRQSLRKSIVFSQHNLVTDASFNEFNVILCRNVLIYFDAALQTRVYQLFHGSLVRRGVLALGEREALPQSELVARYEELEPKEKIYRKIG
jgi:chemotaxis protein methyltransferase CheR